MSIPPYILGLWCADGYWWSSSIGLSNIEPTLIARFGTYLSDLMGRDRLRLRAYRIEGDEIPRIVSDLTDRISIRPPFKMGRTAYHVYVNSRPLLRSFVQARKDLMGMRKAAVGPYIAGRFDGDGTWGTTPRIAYSVEDDARGDQELLKRTGIHNTSVFFYERANEYCLYVQKRDWVRFRSLIDPYVWKATR